MLHKKGVIITLAVLGSILTALAVVFLIITITKKTTDVNTDFSSFSSFFSNDETVQLESELQFTEDDNTPSKIEITELQISSPATNDITVTEDTYTFIGTSDPEKSLKLNGEKIQREENGIFTKTVPLKKGSNNFKFEYDDKIYTYVIRYDYVVMKSYSPSTAQKYSSGSTLTVSVTARANSKVTAELNGSKITLSSHEPQDESKKESDTFATFIGTFKLPSKNKSDLNLGKIKFQATSDGKTETRYSGNITCKKIKIAVYHSKETAPLGGKYINVGKGKITEIVAYEAETFDAYSTNDWSRPTNNYLPKGTVDYSAEGYVYYQSGDVKKEYAVLRYGKQVYTSRPDSTTKKDIAIVKEYPGTLPDHNEIKISSFKTGTSHTTLVLDTLWKAPFNFDILPQKYTNPSKQDYRIDSFTAEYIDITLCYTTVLKGVIKIPKGNPLFKNAKVIKNKSDYTIRLYLKNRGSFYGWDANYNKNGQLVFEFLNPAKIKKANNKYNVNLTGVRVLIDVGHGGIDTGASGFDWRNHNEGIQNLILSKKIAKELKSIGATVYMTRNSDKSVSTHQKIKMLKTLKPDICIAIHHNSSASPSASGFDAYYSQPFSKLATQLVKKYTVKTGIYKKYGLGWHYYYTARSSYCPVVLTENGFMSNIFDYKNIINNNKNNAKATAIVMGIAEYFLKISPDEDYKKYEKTDVSAKPSATDVVSSKPDSSSQTTSSKPQKPSSSNNSSKEEYSSNNSASSQINSSSKTVVSSSKPSGSVSSNIPSEKNNSSNISSPPTVSSSSESVTSSNPNTSIPDISFPNNSSSLENNSSATDNSSEEIGSSEESSSLEENNSSYIESWQQTSSLF